MELEGDGVVRTGTVLSDTLRDVDLAILVVLGGWVTAFCNRGGFRDAYTFTNPPVAPAIFLVGDTPDPYEYTGRYATAGEAGTMPGTPGCP
jgi:hypothetical protein